MTNKQLAALVALIAVAVSGCSRKTLYFGTYSTVGLDVSGTAQIPSHVSLAYSRFEGAYVPPKSGGTNGSHSIYGGMDADIAFFGEKAISQTFATGEAAKIATSAAPPPSARTASTETKPLLFTTGTLFGLELKAGDTEVRPRATLGYRRGEATYIPIENSSNEVRSVYADISINTSTQSIGTVTNFSRTGGVRFRQSFATGAAAENLADTGEIRNKLAEAAGLEAGVAGLIKHEEAQTEVLLNHVASTADSDTVDPAKWNALLAGTALETSGKLDTPISLATMRGKLLNSYASFLDALIANIQ